jgi:hypothetical protein
MKKDIVILKGILTFTSELGLLLASGFIGAVIALSGNLNNPMIIILSFLILSVIFKIWAESLH